MVDNKVPLLEQERINNPKRCPKKHRNAYKTSFGNNFYCPDCGHNVEVKQ